MIKCGIRSLPTIAMSFTIPSVDDEEPASEDFDFSARFSEADPPWSPALMSSADELFCNGQIRPLWYSCEDLMHSSSDDGNRLNSDDDDDGNHFDFRSSADYKFSMFSAHHSPASASRKLQRYVEYGYNQHSLNEDSLHSHGHVSEVVKEESGEGQTATQIVPKRRAYSRQGQEEMIAKQDMMVKVEESRRCSREGGMRRARSLSPLRVFHMDDELPRQSSETNQSSHSVGGNEQGQEQGTQAASHKQSRMTLKELLHSRSQRVEHNLSQMQQQNKAQMKMKMKERHALWLKYSQRHSLDGKVRGLNHPQASMSPHGVYYASQRVHTEHVRQHTFLPYRGTLFGCLGFTSKHYHSASMRSFYSQSQGTR